MNVFEYVQGMAKTFSRSSVLTEANVTRDELVNTVLPLYNKNLPFLKNNVKRMKSELYQRTSKEFIYQFTRSGYLRGNNPFEMINASLNNALALVDWVEGYFNKDTADEVTKSSVTMAKATALQILGAVSFATRYARNWLNVVLSAEYASESMLNEEVDLTPLQIKYINENETTFGMVISMLATPITEVDKIVNDLPELVVSESNPRAIQATLGRKADPFKFGLIQSKWDVFYLIGMVTTDYSVYRYKAAKEEMNLIQMKIHRLKLKYENKDDPRGEAIIEKYQAEFDKLQGIVHAKEREIR